MTDESAPARTRTVPRRAERSLDPYNGRTLLLNGGTSNLEVKIELS
jgi:hypothetical protein